jgi:Ser/Thr protein kinase RdoA (MazF antagonist)
MSGEYGEETLIDLEAMARSALAVYGYSPSASIKLLNVSENATYRIRENDRCSILRLHRVGYHSEVSIRSELAWINALRGANIIETAEPLQDMHGNHVQTLTSTRGNPDRHAVMFGFMEGTEPSPDDALQPWFERLGATTALLHNHAMTWDRPASFVRHVWDTEAMFGEKNLWGAWQAGLGLSKAGETVLGRAVAKINQHLGAYGQSKDRFGLIHADLRLANLLVDGKQLKLIDFDDCGFSWFMYDFASAVSFFEDRPSIPELLDNWYKGYETVRPVSADDRAIMPTLVMARRILLTAWLASHSEVPLAKALGSSYTEGSVALAEHYLANRFLA